MKVDKTLISNTFFLYLLTFSTHFFSLATVPYLTRILGAVTYGKIGIATAYMSYIAIVMDLGFILSATQKVVNHRDDLKYLGKLFSSVCLAKIIVGVIATIIFIMYVALNKTLKADFEFYIFYLLAYLVNAFLPDFYYRGIEKMKIITYRTLLVKAMFMCMIFIFVKQEQDYWKVPVVTLCGNVLAIVIMYYDLIKNYQIRFYKPSCKEFYTHVKDTIPFFVSRIASTVYQVLNTIILSFIYGNSVFVGYYTSADKLVTLSKTCASPIADSLYPYMLREKNFKLIRRFLQIVMPIIVLGALFLFMFADNICVILFGAEFISAGNILRCLLPIMVVILPTYILCFPVMVPLGLSRYANMSNVIGMVIQLVGLIILFMSGNLQIYSICLLSSISEVCVFLFRLGIVLLYVRRPQIISAKK